VSWVELLRSDRARFEIELQEHAGITLDDLEHAGFLDPELEPKIRRLSREARELRVVEWYCDGGHRQPEEPSRAPGHLQVPMRRWGKVPPLDNSGTAVRGRFTVKSKKGRRFEPVKDDEANLAAKTYMDHRDDFRNRDDDGRYATHELYKRGRDPDPVILSRPMVGQLIAAIENGWLKWDHVEEQLANLDEFRTSVGMFTIPRPETQS
jgi:hypothetical protein